MSHANGLADSKNNTMEPEIIEISDRT